MALGSGFFISDDGYVVTNNHVVDNGQAMTVITDDGTEYNAKVIGKDDKTDLALLKVDAKDKKFTYVKFAEGETRVGDWVVAVGNPFGLGGTVTAGIVSARGREIGAGPYDDFIQIDAAVNRGNSGGPAFNLNGEVIGVNTAIFSPSGGNVGIAFAIPASTAERIINDLKEHGTVVRGWLGVQIQNITQDIADSLGLKDAKGALVSDPQDGGPAVKAGLKSGDAITAVNGQAITDPRDLASKIAGMAPGTKVTVTYWRDGKSNDVEVTLGKLPATDQQASNDAGSSQDVKPSSLEDFGLAIAPSDDNSGVVVTDVDPNGQAAEKGMQAGDVILSVGD
jgi:serine protease Do